MLKLYTLMSSENKIENQSATMLVPQIIDCTKTNQELKRGEWIREGTSPFPREHSCTD
jgi:hypothetical protein